MVITGDRKLHGVLDGLKSAARDLLLYPPELLGCQGDRHVHLYHKVAGRQAPTVCPPLRATFSISTVGMVGLTGMTLKILSTLAVQGAMPALAAR